MKTIVTKNQVQAGAINVVKVVAVPLHMAVQLSANILNNVADCVAIGEAKVTVLIDKSKDEATVAKARVEYTKDKFEEAGFMVLLAKHKIQDAMEKADKAIDKSIVKVKATISNTADKTESAAKEVCNKVFRHSGELPTATPEEAFGTNEVKEPIVLPNGWKLKAVKPVVTTENWKPAIQ
jgi:hypothetical protein